MINSLPSADTTLEVETVEGNIFDIQRFSVNDGPGIRTIVFFKSCPLRCLWCSNPESQHTMPELMYSRSRCLAECSLCVDICPTHALVRTEQGIVVDRDKCDACGKCSAICPGRALRIAGRRVTVGEALAEVTRDRIFYEHSGGGLTLSGGEPLAQPEFALALLRGARRLGLHTAVETSGATSPETIRRVLGETDLILFDIKHLQAARHRSATGMSSDAIVRNAALAAGLGVKMIIRVPLITGFNDNREDLTAIAEFARALGLDELHVLPYHRYGLPKYAALGRDYALPDLPLPSPLKIQTVRELLNDFDLAVHVGG